MADPVLALEDEVGGGESRIRGRPGRSRRWRTRGPRRAGSKTGGSGSVTAVERSARGAQRGPVRRGDEGQRLGVMEDLAADRDEDRLVGLDRARRRSRPGCRPRSRRRPSTNRTPGSRSSVDEAGMGVGRADRRAVPGAGEDEVVGVLGGPGELGRTLAPKRRRPAREPSATIVPGVTVTGRRAGRSGSSCRARPTPPRLTLSPGPRCSSCGKTQRRDRAGASVAAVAERPPGRRAGVDAVGDDQRAGHDDVLDADGNERGSSYVAVDRTVAGSKTTRSATYAVADHAPVAKARAGRPAPRSSCGSPPRG